MRKKCSLATEEQMAKVKRRVLLFPITSVPVPGVPAPTLALALGASHWTVLCRLLADCPRWALLLRMVLAGNIPAQSLGETEWGPFGWMHWKEKSQCIKIRPDFHSSVQSWGSWNCQEVTEWHSRSFQENISTLFNVRMAQSWDFA